jgi:hypothetical protein
MIHDTRRHVITIITAIMNVCDVFSSTLSSGGNADCSFLDADAITDAVAPDILYTLSIFLFY